MTMKLTCTTLLFSLLLISCNDEQKAPDISNISYEMELKRFDQDFFAIDTQQIDHSLSRLGAKYPQLLGIFLQNILAISDPSGLNAYMRNYRPVFDSIQDVFGNMQSVKSDLEKAYRFVKYYYPEYDLPKSLVAVVGPFDTREDLARMSSGELTPNFLGPDFVGVSLQFYLGADYSLYNSEHFINNVTPLFRSRRFSKEYLVPDIMRLVADDIYPDRSFTLSLIDQMIEKGKRWWLMGKFLPDAADSTITGYTKVQTEWTASNEGMIWSYIVKNEKLDSKEPPVIQNYLGEAPFTIGLPQEYSPGNIGVWLGRQIVRKFEKENSHLSVDEIMKTPAEKILQEAKYRPK